MSISIIYFEKILLKYVEYIKAFNEYLIKEYNLNDIPYNVSGKAFPKIGKLNINGENVNYRFHGKGCTISWNGIEICYDTDASSVNQIILSAWAYRNFLSYVIPGYNENDYPFTLIDNILFEFEKRGILMTRKPNEQTFHVNEMWYQAIKNNKVFLGDNKDNIDW